MQHAKLPCPSKTPGAYSNSCLESWWCHPTISSSFVPFSSHLQSFPASESFPMSQFLASGSQRIGVSASVSVLPMNIQDWFPLGWTGWISLLSKRLSRVFSNNTVQKHQFFCAQLSLQSNSQHLYMTIRKNIALTRWTFINIPLYGCMYLGFPGGSDSKVSACNAGDWGSNPRLGRSPGERSSNPL